MDKKAVTNASVIIIRSRERPHKSIELFLLWLCVRKVSIMLLYDELSYCDLIPKVPSISRCVVGTFSLRVHLR
jgi:hypothetical protein